MHLACRTRSRHRPTRSSPRDVNFHRSEDFQDHIFRTVNLVALPSCMIVSTRAIDISFFCHCTPWTFVPSSRSTIFKLATLPPFCTVRLSFLLPNASTGLRDGVAHRYLLCCLLSLPAWLLEGVARRSVALSHPSNLSPSFANPRQKA